MGIGNGLTQDLETGFIRGSGPLSFQAHGAALFGSYTALYWVLSLLREWVDIFTRKGLTSMQNICSS